METKEYGNIEPETAQKLHMLFTKIGCHRPDNEFTEEEKNSSFYKNYLKNKENPES